MADQGSIANLKQNINENIIQNTTKEITGTKMNTVLNNIVDTLNFNGRDFFNVNEYREKSDEYANAAAGRAAVPDEVKKIGLVITYLLADGWRFDQFIGDDILDWGEEDKWLSLIDQLNAFIKSTNHILTGVSFVNPGIIKDDGVKNDNPASPYRRTDILTLNPDQIITVRCYGSTGLNALALYGTSEYGKLQRLFRLPISDDGFGVITYKNKTGHILYAVATTKSGYKNDSFVKIEDSTPSINEQINLTDIFIEKGVCLFSTKTYTCYDNLTVYPYRTYFVPVKENQMLFIDGGSYPSTFQVFASNANHEYIDNLMNIRGADNKYDPGELNPYKITIAIPEGVTMVGITNRNDEYLTPSIIRYSDNDIIDWKIRPLSKNYNLSPQKGHIAFVVDGGYDEDTTLKALFDAKGVKAGWALLWPFVWPTLYGMGNHYDKYLSWQNEGHEIMVHSGAVTTWNDINYAVPSNPTEQAAFAKMRFEQFMGIGLKVRGFCQLGSQVFPTESQRKPVYNSFEYAFTRATNEITEPDQGAVMMPTDKPWNLGRSTLETITLAQMKGLIDECATKKGLLVIYCHSWRIGNASYPNQTWENFGEMIDYAKSKCEVDIPYNCILSLYANHIE